MASEPAGRVNFCDMTVNTGTLVISPVDNRCAERITDFGIDIGQSVIEANTESYIVWNIEVVR